MCRIRFDRLLCILLCCGFPGRARLAWDWCRFCGRLGRIWLLSRRSSLAFRCFDQTVLISLHITLLHSKGAMRRCITGSVLCPCSCVSCGPLRVATIVILLRATRLRPILIAILVTLCLPIFLSLPGALFMLLTARFLLGLHFALRLRQKPRVMLGMLLKVLSCDTVVRQLRIPRKNLVFLDNLLRRSAHLAFGARAVKNTVDDIAKRLGAVRLGTRTFIG